MKMLKLELALGVLLLNGLVLAAESPDPDRDILVTFDNGTARSASAGLAAPYQRRKQYSIARQVRRDSADLAHEYSLQEIDHWPIQSLSVYCFVYRVPEGEDRLRIIATLNADPRVESAQPLQSFETNAKQGDTYDDTYFNLQYGLEILDIGAAHRTTRGEGIRIAIIDSNVDVSHEDLHGRIDRVRKFSNNGEAIDEAHGTAVASVIGARTNNAVGIVGIAPEATLELYVSCWSGGEKKPAICDTFSLSKALDAILEDPPHVLNLSLIGPYDPLLERLIEKASDAGVVVVAAAPSSPRLTNNFPSILQHVIGVAAASTGAPVAESTNDTLFAPGDRILVAVPTDSYDFRSGSSLAAAHVSGVVALLLSIAPDHSPEMISNILRRSQVEVAGPLVSINACDALNLASTEQRCGD